MAVAVTVIRISTLLPDPRLRRAPPGAQMRTNLSQVGSAPLLGPCTTGLSMRFRWPGSLPVGGAGDPAPLWSPMNHSVYVPVTVLPPAELRYPPAVAADRAGA